ncbi:hypothetical protein J1614_012098 [Plenodomus biglobosus]|nr:hypothetical protein J1614_012098 [Plenodomus biglobosus]
MESFGDQYSLKVDCDNDDSDISQDTLQSSLNGSEVDNKKSPETICQDDGTCVQKCEAKQTDMEADTKTGAGVVTNDELKNKASIDISAPTRIDYEVANEIITSLEEKSGESSQLHATTDTPPPSTHKCPGRDNLCSPRLLQYFLCDNEGAIPSWDAKVIKRFLSRQADGKAACGDIDAWAWVDDREYLTGRTRDYPKALDADALYDVLSILRSAHGNLPAVDRRLIYISRLTPRFVQVLATTAWSHQGDVLRDMIRKHIKFETNFRVLLPMVGYPTFSMEFHISYLTLREVTGMPHRDGASVDEGANLSSVDLSFLDLGPSSSANTSYSIDQAQISIVVCGWSNTHWTGYAFANTGSRKNLYEESDQEEDDENCGEDTVFKQDLFAAEDGFDFATHVQTKKWDARRYWLRIVAIRCRSILQEWQFLVHSLEEGIESSRKRDPCTGSTSGLDLSPDDVHRSLDRTIQTVQVLRKLRDSISTTIRAYERFDQPGGDASYFADLTDNSNIQAAIKETFERLADLNLNLTSLDDSCQHFATHLGRILSLEGNRLAAQSNRLDHENKAISIRNYELTSESNAIGLKNHELTRESNKLNIESNELNRRSHELNSESNRLNLESNHLNKESNRVSLESHELSEQTHRLNVRSSDLNEKLRELNEKSADAACANLAAAAKTSRSTRVNVELLLFTTPFAMVLQYFGSENNIFSFKRNPTTFVVATLILMLILRILTLLLEHADGLIKLATSRGFSRSNKQPRVANNPGIALQPVQPV